MTLRVPGYPHDIEIQVLELNRWSVKLGFTAPRDVQIERDDVKKTPEAPPSYGRQAGA